MQLGMSVRRNMLSTVAHLISPETAKDLGML